MAQEAKPRICKECGRLLPIDAFEPNRYENGIPSVWRSECKECRKNAKPFPRIPERKKREYVSNHPQPKIGEDFYCRICDRTITIQQNRDVNLDHDHTTGEIRGWICNRCNTGLGNFRDNISVLKRAIRWLQRTLMSLF